MRRFARFACIDWSGARGERLKGIAIAQCWEGRAAPALVAPIDGALLWSRQTVLDWLLARAEERADVLIGVDFSAALPFDRVGGYFPGRRGAPRDARALWAEIDRRCAADPHLAATSYVGDPELARYFRVGTATGAGFAHATDRNGRLRAVEREAASGNPASCFNLVGAKQVGRSSLTGMRVLHRLAGRVPVWPFDPVPEDGPLIVEIYTSIAAIAAGRPRGATKMRRVAAMNAALAAPALCSDPVPGSGAIEDHAGDAIVTAAWLRRAAACEAPWHPAVLRRRPSLARTEGWTFGVP